jgi:hypothetical protein
VWLASTFRRRAERGSRVVIGWRAFDARVDAGWCPRGGSCAESDVALHVEEADSVPAVDELALSADRVTLGFEFTGALRRVAADSLTPYVVRVDSTGAGVLDTLEEAEFVAHDSSFSSSSSDNSSLPSQAA